jgi:hypothetical protein
VANNNSCVSGSGTPTALQKSSIAAEYGRTSIRGIRQFDVKLSPSEGAMNRFDQFFKDFFAWFNAFDESSVKLMF